MDSRDHALARLRAGYVADNLTFEEFSEHVDRVFSARTQAELDRVVANLPQASVRLPFDQADYDVVQPHLLENERVLWVGKPDPNKMATRADVFLIPFSLFFGGFAIFWEVLALTGPFGVVPIFPIFGLPFVLAGLYLMMGRFVYKARLKGRTTYAVTNRRVLRIVQRARGDAVASAFLSTIPMVNSTAGTDGVGTVTFGSDAPFFANTGVDFIGSTGSGVPISFFDVPAATKVAELVVKLRDEPLGN